MSEPQGRELTLLRPQGGPSSGAVTVPVVLAYLKNHPVEHVELRPLEALKMAELLTAAAVRILAASHERPER